MKVDVDCVESDEEVAEHILLGLRDVLEQLADDGFSSRELASAELTTVTHVGANCNEELECLGVNVTNFDASLATLSATPTQVDSLSEKDIVSLSGRGDADVVLCLSRVRAERLNDECVEGTSGLLNLAWLSSPLLDPLAGSLPVLVEAQETGLASSLDQLIGFTNELGAEDPFRESGPRSNRRSESLGLGIPGPS